jgi:hypothetical protein
MVEAGKNDVRLWHLADMQTALTNVCFWGQSGHGEDLSAAPTASEAVAANATKTCLSMSF